MITAEGLKQRLAVINCYWKEILAKYAKCTGTDEECENIVNEVNKIHKSFNETSFSKDMAVAVINELDKIMTDNNGGKCDRSKVKIVELNCLIKDLRKNGFDSAAEFIEKKI